MKYSVSWSNMASEEVLFFSENVRYKKNNGKLTLLSDKILWTADGAEKPRLSYSYSDIKGKIFYQLIVNCSG